MNILWITNILFPEVQLQLCGSCFNSFGGWMIGAAEELIQDSDITLFVATVSPMVNELVKVNGKKINYFVIPYGKGNTKYNSDYKKYWRSIHTDVNPDVVHIHGTEFSHGLAYMKECGTHNVVISIQGLLSVISNYYCSGISIKDILSNLSIRDIISGTIWHEKSLFQKRSKYETEMIQMSKHIIGRTSWDQAHISIINPDAYYHFCNEIVRSEFYTSERWSYSNCTKFTIFLSQASYPIKGFHQLLKALPIILKKYPMTQVRVAGPSPFNNRTWIDRFKLSGYNKYLLKLIERNNLQSHIVFTGNLCAEEMKKEYLGANVFVCPSSIENSPNSLAEAQILGVPCIASYVGGIPDMMAGNEDNLYRFEETLMLASKICKVFENKDLQIDMRETALIRHNCQHNTKILLGIYKQIKK